MEKKKVRTRKGKVISDKMDKSIVVAVETLVEHKKYRKKYRSTKKYKVHDPENKARIGDIVEFVECRPISKEKRHKLVQVVSNRKTENKKSKEE